MLRIIFSTFFQCVSKPWSARLDKSSTATFVHAKLLPKLIASLKTNLLGEKKKKTIKSFLNFVLYFCSSISNFSSVKSYFSGTDLQFWNHKVLNVKCRVGCIGARRKNKCPGPNQRHCFCGCVRLSFVLQSIYAYQMLHSSVFSLVLCVGSCEVVDIDIESND